MDFGRREIQTVPFEEEGDGKRKLRGDIPSKHVCVVVLGRRAMAVFYVY